MKRNRALILQLLLSAFATSYCAAVPIKHVIVIVKENRTFDTYFGTFPGANGTTTGVLSTGKVIPLAHAKDTTPDCGHDWVAAHADWDKGKMDGFNLVAPCNTPPYNSYVQYLQSDIPNYWKYATTYGISDSFFSSIRSASFPNHLWIFADQSGEAITNPNGVFGSGTTDWGCAGPSTAVVTKLDPTTDKTFTGHPCTEIQTMGDVLDKANITWTYYAGLYNKDHLAAWFWNAPGYVEHIRFGADWNNVKENTEFLTDLAAGNLPQVVWLMPPGKDSEHPPASVTAGENWTVNQINAIMNSPFWSSTVIFVTWDDFGGMYDHLSPQDADVYGNGFRVPLLVISPYAKPEYISHVEANFDSINAYIEQLFHTGCLTARDCGSKRALKDFFNYAQKPLPPLVLQPRPVPAASTAQPLIIHGIAEKDDDDDGDDQ